MLSRASRRVGSDALRSDPAAVRAIGWGWRHAGRRAWALADVDLSVQPGERVLLLGASGSGKSTLLAGLAGVLGGDDDGEERGSLLIDGRHPRSSRGRVGLVLQDPESQIVMARVGDEVAFGCENLGVPAREIPGRVAEALSAVGLDVPLDHPTNRLSGGQKQRLAIASVLAMRPGLILLDEPTANLDPAGVVEVRDAVTRLDTTLVIVEHRVAVWADAVDRVVVLAGDGVVADGAPGAVLGRESSTLSAAGIWVPGAEVVERPAPRPGTMLLTASALAVGRTGFVRDGVDLSIAAREAVVVTGPNGAGKSTLALTIAGLIPSLGGRLEAAPTLADGRGTDPMRWRSRELLPRIGTVFQSPEHQFLTSTVRDELAVGPRALGRDLAVVDELLARLRLDDLAGAHPFTLSGGQKRRLSVGTALATAPRLLVLDEPTFGQDARTWAELVALLDELRAEGAGLVLVTHDDMLRLALDAREVAL